MTTGGFLNLNAWFLCICGRLTGKWAVFYILHIFETLKCVLHYTYLKFHAAKLLHQKDTTSPTEQKNDKNLHFPSFFVLFLSPISYILYTILIRCSLRSRLIYNLSFSPKRCSLHSRLTYKKNLPMSQKSSNFAGEMKIGVFDSGYGGLCL